MRKGNYCGKSGFTLIELAIVLVIIGLIAGGIVVGKSLIDAAEERAMLNEVQRYNAAINTFRDKYNGLPGDLTNAIDFWPTATTNVQNGDGNGMIRNNIATPYRGETIYSHLELKLSGLLPDAAPPPSPTYTPWLSDAPHVGKFSLGIGKENTVGDAPRTDNWILVGVGNGSLYSAFYPALSSMETYLLDKKIDNGISNSGKFKASGLGGNPSHCTTSNSYNGNYTYDEEFVVVPGNHLLTYGCTFNISFY